MSELDRIEKCSDWIEKRFSGSPEIGMVLGSGLADAMRSLVEKKEDLDWAAIPSFPEPTVQGHTGKFMIVAVGDKKLLIQQGRLHWYEGHSWNDVIFPIRVQKKLGIQQLIMTNAAGGINKTYEPGDLCLIEDHINFSGDNPLRGENLEEFGPRFPDLSHAYDQYLRKKALEAAGEMNLELKRGVYAMTSGPSYETPAEILALRKLGADLVGMSTVPESIAANHSGMDVLAVSCVTNKAAGMQEKLTHKEVIQVTSQVNKTLGKLILNTVKKI